MSAYRKRLREIVASVPCKLGEMIEMQFDPVLFDKILLIYAKKMLFDFLLGKML